MDRRSSSYRAGASCNRGEPASSRTTTPNSTIVVELEPMKSGARLTLTHTGVPDGQTSYEEGGWRDFYFEPMKAYFEWAKKKAQPKGGG